MQPFHVTFRALSALKKRSSFFSAWGMCTKFFSGSSRATKWKKQKKKSLMRLLPDDDSLEQHIKRANFLAYIQRHPDLRRHPSPIGHGWELVNGCCRPVRHTKPALPISLPVPSTQQDGYDSDSESLNWKLHLNLILILNLTHRMSWSHRMNLELN